MGKKCVADVFVVCVTYITWNLTITPMYKRLGKFEKLHVAFYLDENNGFTLISIDNILDVDGKK